MHREDQGDYMANKTSFQLVKKVLDELRAEIITVTGTDAGADDAIAKEVKRLSACYLNLTDPAMPPIDYSHAITRCAYIYSTVVANSDFVYQALRESGDLVASVLLTSERPIVTCIGGGPGSELIGLLRYVFDSNAKPKSLTCYLCDREQAWADSWTDLGQELDGQWPLFVNFQQLDVLNASTWTKQRKFLSADLFIASYFASEIMRMGNASLPFWHEFFASAKKDALLLVVDFDHVSTESYVASITSTLGWIQIYSKSGRRTLSGFEQKGDLGELLGKFDRSPRTQGSVIVKLFRKT